MRVSGREFPALARLLSPDKEAELTHHIQELSRQKYGWGDGLVIELIPD